MSREHCRPNALRTIAGRLLAGAMGLTLFGAAACGAADPMSASDDETADEATGLASAAVAAPVFPAGGCTQNGQVSFLCTDRRVTPHRQFEHKIETKSADFSGPIWSGTPILVGAHTFHVRGGFKDDPGAPEMIRKALLRLPAAHVKLLADAHVDYVYADRIGPGTVVTGGLMGPPVLLSWSSLFRDAENKFNYSLTAIHETGHNITNLANLRAPIRATCEGPLTSHCITSHERDVLTSFHGPGHAAITTLEPDLGHAAERLADVYMFYFQGKLNTFRDDLRTSYGIPTEADMKTLAGMAKRIYGLTPAAAGGASPQGDADTSEGNEPMDVPEELAEE
jgi:hypothetical protein